MPCGKGVALPGEGGSGDARFLLASCDPDGVIAGALGETIGLGVRSTGDVAEARSENDMAFTCSVVAGDGVPMGVVLMTGAGRADGV